jgi:hypothetical protein
MVVRDASALTGGGHAVGEDEDRLKYEESRKERVVVDEEEAAEAQESRPGTRCVIAMLSHNWLVQTLGSRGDTCYNRYKRRKKGKRAVLVRTRAGIFLGFLMLVLVENGLDQVLYGVSSITILPGTIVDATNLRNDRHRKQAISKGRLEREPEEERTDWCELSRLPTMIRKRLRVWRLRKRNWPFALHPARE